MAPQHASGDRLSDEQRWAIISAWKKCENMAQVARGLSKEWKHVLLYKRVKYWVAVYKRQGTVAVRKQPGRPSVISTKAARAAVELLVDSVNFGIADTDAAELHKRGLTMGAKPVNKSTLIRVAMAQSKKDLDQLEMAKGKPLGDLSEATKKKRLEFATKFLNFNWAHVMFTDRKKFVFEFPGTKVKTKRWIKKSKGGKHGNKCWQPNNPQGLNLYMGITKWGPPRSTR
jgi:hypothetical protein